jgi:hypothetical protein
MWVLCLMENRCEMVIRYFHLSPERSPYDFQEEFIETKNFYWNEINSLHFLKNVRWEIKFNGDWKLKTVTQGFLSIHDSRIFHSIKSLLCFFASHSSIHSTTQNFLFLHQCNRKTFHCKTERKSGSLQNIIKLLTLATTLNDPFYISSTFLFLTYTHKKFFCDAIFHCKCIVINFRAEF